MGIVKKILRPYTGTVYRLGLATPEPEYETAIGRRLFTVTQLEQYAASAVDAERERICAAIKAEDHHCAGCDEERTAT